MARPQTANPNDRRFERFHPMTVRAAGRLARLALGGQLNSHEIDCYLRELAAMEPHSSEQTVRRLKRLARWRASFQSRTVHSPAGSRRLRAGERRAWPPSAARD